MAKRSGFLLFFFFCCLHLQSVNGELLSSEYYRESCPNVDRIVKNVVTQKLLEAPTTAAGALRLFFHDCFVEGCDASVLVASSEKNVAERDAEINLSLPGDGFDVFFRAKRALEWQCPGIVSCADVMAIATRDLVQLVGGPEWEVYKGRKDGKMSKASRVAGNLPLVNQTIDQLISLFNSKGLSIQDMVALSGAHTIGFAHCNEFMPRIYNFNKTFEIDPAMDQAYALSLRSPCPQKGIDPTIVANNDISTPTTFDNAYYRNLQKGLGLLGSDQGLYANPKTRGYVEAFAKDQQLFFDYFVKAMHKLGGLGVKMGGQGEVRRDCGFFNG
ncbi:peroxidase 31 [Amborella trichopoda]|uniref:Peroxidase n=1 Tax=Amborella trichopoda TaxID=13333 RepID=W1PNS7_AMBTC|nr:peroxidase 31 [Amborella trichopoda]ERN09381.1 hypothetical protein AMTR_s00029p00030990 [Amborella trichopoda]|eukprot:XP_006847800.1 peroxidase 31 [Amborella trichopoda]